MKSYEQEIYKILIGQTEEECLELNEATTSDIQKALSSTPKGLTIHMKHKDSGETKSTTFMGTHSAVAAAKSHINSMKKKGYEFQKHELVEAEMKKDDKAPFEPGKPSKPVTPGKYGQEVSKVRHLARQAMPKTQKEEVEELDELSKSTLASYAKKSSNDARMSGQIAKDFENKSSSYRKPEMKASAARLAGEYKKRSWKREDGVMKAIDRLAKEEVEEEVDQTIIEHKAFDIELPETLRFGDYLTAAKKLVESEDEAIIVANEFFKEQDESLVIESFTRADIEDKVKAHQRAGHEVSMPKYSTKEGKPYAEYTVTNKETNKKTKYIHHGSTRRVVT